MRVTVNCFLICFRVSIMGYTRMTADKSTAIVFVSG
jgi:hypothetical protein